MGKFYLSAFSDEYSPIFDEQLIGLKKNNIGFMEIRGADKKSIVKHTLPEVEVLKKKLDDANIKISSIGSPIGKYKIELDFEEHYKVFLHTLEIAKILDCNKMRIFSFFVQQSELKKYRDEVMRRLDMLLNKATQENIILCHENEAEIYGMMADECVDIQNEFGGAIRCIFDPANFVLNGQNIPDAWAKLNKYVDYMHIKDAIYGQDVVPAGEGDGEFNMIFSDLAKVDKNFCCTMEPHLKVFDGLAGLANDADAFVSKNAYASNEEAFEAAVAAFRKVIGNNEIHI